MPQDNWVTKSRNTDVVESTSETRSTRPMPLQNRGNLIMDVAEKLRPWLLKIYEGVRDEHGMLLQPAHVRGIALNVAQQMVREYDNRA